MSRFVPVLSPRFPLDFLLAPYAKRLCGHSLTSVPELLSSPDNPIPGRGMPLWLDSGGYALLSDPGAQITNEDAGLSGLRLTSTITITPQRVFELQCALATVGFTLDFPARQETSPATQADHAERAYRNAAWALAQPRQFQLYAAVQPFSDLKPYLKLNPDGVALGGLAPYSADRTYLQSEVSRVRAEIGPQLPLHVFGIGHPQSVRAVMEAGATSVDSSGPQRRAADGRTWTGETLPEPSVAERARLAILNLKASQEAADGVNA